jgi:hypothetical protein
MTVWPWLLSPAFPVLVIVLAVALAVAAVRARHVPGLVLVILLTEMTLAAWGYGFITTHMRFSVS